jgi:hypothetical protein
VADLIDIAQFDQLLGQQSHRPALSSSFRLTPSQRHQPCLQFPIPFPLLWPLRLKTPDQGIQQPSFQKAPTHSLHCCPSDRQGFGDALIAPACSLLSLIRFQQDPRMRLAAC